MRWMFRIVGALLVAVLLVLGGLLLLPGERIAKIAADQIAARTGRTLEIGGEVSVTIWPVLGVRTGPVVLGNADWAGPEPMLTAEGLTIGVAAPDLLRGAIRITEITADAPVLRLQTAPDGRGNWQFGAPGMAAEAGGSASDGAATPLTLERLELTGARLVHAAAGEAPVELRDLDLSLSWPDRSGPAELRLVLRPAGDPLEVTARIDRFDAFLGGGESAIAARAAAPGGEIGFDGRAGLGGAAAGAVTLRTSDTARMLAALGMPGVDLPRGLGRAADISGQLALAPGGTLILRDLALDLDGNRLNGSAEIASGGARPRVTATLAGGDLDLSGLAPESAPSQGGPAGSTASGWSTTPIDTAALALLDGSLDLTARSIDLGRVTLGPTRAGITVERKRAVLDLAELAVFGGSVTGKLIANDRDGLSVAAKLQAAGIDMQEVLTAFAGFDRLSGTGRFEVDLLGAGPTQDAIMRSLSGSGAVRIGRGVISGIDLDQLLRSGLPTGGTTVFDTLKASFTVAKGDLTNDDLLLKLAKLRVVGEGRIGLGARDIDYLITPRLKTGPEGKRLAIPVRILGPWAAPRFVPDLDGALQSELGVSSEELKAKARAEVERKLAKELDLTIKEGQDAVDALKDKLEDEVKKGLLKLLGQD